MSGAMVTMTEATRRRDAATAGGAFGAVMVPDYGLAVRTYTFVGEVVLLIWALWRAVRGFPATTRAGTAA